MSGRSAPIPKPVPQKTPAQTAAPKSTGSDKETAHAENASDLIAQARTAPQVQATAQLQALADGSHQVRQLEALRPPAPNTGVAPLQMAWKEVGKDREGVPLKSRANVQRDLGGDDYYTWPVGDENANFSNADYFGAVKFALDWGATGGEGTSGWSGREFSPAEFDTIATTSGAAINGLAGNAALNLNSNKILIAIRAFRGPPDGSMGTQTLTDLRAVYDAVNRARAGLAGDGMIAAADTAITAVKSDPAEAHPNTLPTSQVTFADGAKVFFKGRSHAVEDALIGTGNSAAKKLSELNGGDAAADDAVGMHKMTGDANTQIGADVGPYAAKNVAIPDQPTGLATILPLGWGGQNPVPAPTAIEGWVSAVKSAYLASLTATEDLHASNLVAGGDGKKHIIDGEFLLDVTAWDKYRASLKRGQAPVNFLLDAMVPDWLSTHTQTRTALQKTVLADAVITALDALNLDRATTQNTILQPIRAMIDAGVLLRVSPPPFITGYWLGAVAEYYNQRAEEDQTLDEARTGFTEVHWDRMADFYPEKHIDLLNKPAGVAELKSNFGRGMVPLFHIKSDDGQFMLNKRLQIGQLRDDRSIPALLNLTKMSVRARYEDMMETVRRVITT